MADDKEKSDGDLGLSASHAKMLQRLWSQAPVQDARSTAERLDQVVFSADSVDFGPDSAGRRAIEAFAPILTVDDLRHFNGIQIARHEDRLMHDRRTRVQVPNGDLIRLAGEPHKTNLQIEKVAGAMTVLAEKCVDVDAQQLAHESAAIYDMALIALTMGAKMGLAEKLQSISRPVDKNTATLSNRPEIITSWLTPRR